MGSVFTRRRSNDKQLPVSRVAFKMQHDCAIFAGRVMGEKILSLIIVLGIFTFALAGFMTLKTQHIEKPGGVFQSKILTFLPMPDAAASSDAPSQFISKPIDAVQSSVVPVCSAILMLLAILLFKVENEFLRYPDPPELDGHFKILFRTLISPNAP